VEYQNLLYGVEGPLALLTLNRPQRLNAVSLAMLEELHDALGRAEGDERVRAIAVTGAGDRAFCSGSDLEEVQRRDPRQALAPLVQGVAERLQRAPKPTLAAVNGICFGGGLELALACDLRIASSHASFATPEGNLGIIPGGGATQRLPRLVGRAWALEMLLLGETLGAEQALRIGLVTRLVPPSELLPTAAKMAEQLARQAPLVPQVMKAMVNAGLEASLTAGLALEKFAQSALCATEDKAEGLRAFLEKREPRWRGR
jgi:enoyl-CoA hydratase